MATVTIPNTFSNNTVADAGEVNSNFSTIYNEFNGSISNSNVSATADIVESKLLFSGTGHGHGGTTDGQVIQLRRFVGSFTRATTAASGTQAVTGVGFTPQIVLFLMANNAADTNEASVGFDMTTLQVALNTPDAGTNGAGIFEVRTNASIAYIESAANSYTGEITSMDSDGFTINWTRNNTPTATIVVGFLALALTSP